MIQCGGAGRIRRRANVRVTNVYNARALDEGGIPPIIWRLLVKKEKKKKNLDDATHIQKKRMEERMKRGDETRILFFLLCLHLFIIIQRAVLLWRLIGMIRDISLSLSSPTT